MDIIGRLAEIQQEIQTAVFGLKLHDLYTKFDVLVYIYIYFFF